MSEGAENAICAYLSIALLLVLALSALLVVGRSSHGARDRRGRHSRGGRELARRSLLRGLLKATSQRRRRSWGWRARAVQKEYERLAGEYDHRWPQYIADSVRATLQRLEANPRDRLLDVGCGTGSLLEALHRRRATATLAGVDLSLAMFGVARRKLADRAWLMAANAERLPLRASSFDVAVSTSSLHYWARPETCLAEVGRVLRPAGRLLVTDWCDDYLACRLCDLVLRLVDPSHHRAYGTKDCARLLENAGYEIRSLERYKINWLWGLMTAVATRSRRTGSPPTM